MARPAGLATCASFHTDICLVVAEVPGGLLDNLFLGWWYLGRCEILTDWERFMCYRLGWPWFMYVPGGILDAVKFRCVVWLAQDAKCFLGDICWWNVSTCALLFHTTCGFDCCLVGGLPVLHFVCEYLCFVSLIGVSPLNCGIELVLKMPMTPCLLICCPQPNRVTKKWRCVKYVFLVCLCIVLIGHILTLWFKQK